jgi:hypothetical protein
MKKHSNQRTSKSTGTKIFQQFLTEQHHQDAKIHPEQAR